jgi:transcriptional regulator with XRE-family HTH domain
VAVRVDSERLREAREDALLSQRELGEKAGVSADTILRMEAGEGGAYGRTVRRIASALNMDYRDLLAGADKGKLLAR